ncbi:MAG TPA: phosphatase PAP2 family protein [Angustibacter sp.]|nr:phosphatase PAP2 family protein [Angustibacter sp.]
MSTRASDPRPRLLAGAAAMVASAVPVVLIALMVRDVADPLVRFDLRILRVTTGWTLRHDWLRTAAEVGAIVLHPWVFRLSVLAAALVLWRRGAQSAAMWAASTMVVGTLLGAVLKLIVSRARPALDDPVATATGFSFPSGHSLNAALGVSLLVALLWRPAHDHGRRALLLGVGGLLIVLTGLDRVLLGVHFPSDVVAGWLVGVLVVVSSWVAFGPVLRERARREAERAVDGEPTSDPAPDGGASAGSTPRRRV